MTNSRTTTTARQRVSASIKNRKTDMARPAIITFVLALLLVAAPAALAQQNQNQSASAGSTATAQDTTECDACELKKKLEEHIRQTQARQGFVCNTSYYPTPGYDWNRITFADNEELEVVKDEERFKVVRLAEESGATTTFVFPKHEFVTGCPAFTDEMARDFTAMQSTLEHLWGSSDRAEIRGTENYEPNDGPSIANQTSSRGTASNRAASDADLADTRADIVEEAFSLSIDDYISRVKLTGLGQVNSNVVQEDMSKLSDIGKVMNRKGYFFVFRSYAPDQAPPTSVDELNRLRNALTADIDNVRDTALLALETARRAEGKADQALDENVVQDGRLTALENESSGDGFSALSAGYVSRLGLSMGQVSFEAGKPFSVRFALGGSPGGVDTQLCEDDLGVSKAYFASTGGRYTLRPTEWLSLGLGASASGTVLSLEKSKGLVVLSAGPDAMARVNFTDHVGLQAGVGVNARYFMEDGVTTGDAADTIAPNFNVGLTVTF